MTREKVLVVGGYGMIGSVLFYILRHKYANKIDAIRSHHRSVPHTPDRRHSHINLLSETTFGLELSRIKPDVVYLCAAFTDVDRCEDCPEAFDINLTGTTKLIHECLKRDIKVVFFSSSYVFDGTMSGYGYSEKDIPNPVNNYGAYKLDVENHVLYNPRGLVIRTVGVFDEEVGQNFKSQVMRSATINAPIDQYMNPIHALDLAKLSIQVERLGVTGIVNIAGDRCLSKYTWARNIRRANNLDPLDVLPFSGDIQKAKRPKNGCLSIEKLRGYFPNLKFNYPELSLDY